MYRTYPNCLTKCREAYQGTLRYPIQAVAASERQLPEEGNDSVLPGDVEILHTSRRRECKIEDHRALLQRNQPRLLSVATELERSQHYLQSGQPAEL